MRSGAQATLFPRVAHVDAALLENGRGATSVVCVGRATVGLAVQDADDLVAGGFEFGESGVGLVQGVGKVDQAAFGLWVGWVESVGCVGVGKVRHAVGVGNVGVVEDQVGLAVDQRFRINAIIFVGSKACHVETETVADGEGGRIDLGRCGDVDDDIGVGDCGTKDKRRGGENRDKG